ncbi:hypothetical protein M8818_000399 [Zalaria obscura]|uniref:Uncharacterized protein n=1 Tax=Zalaria obscura TaxID=2024903 RepID=A0ACC3SMR9_9PEZI
MMAFAFTELRSDDISFDAALSHCHECWICPLSSRDAPMFDSHGQISFMYFPEQLNNRNSHAFEGNVLDAMDAAEEGLSLIDEPVHAAIVVARVVQTVREVPCEVGVLDLNLQTFQAVRTFQETRQFLEQVEIAEEWCTTELFLQEITAGVVDTEVSNTGNELFAHDVGEMGLDESIREDQWLTVEYRACLVRDLTVDKEDAWRVDVQIRERRKEYLKGEEQSSRADLTCAPSRTQRTENRSMYVVGWIVPSITWKVSALLRLRANTCIFCDEGNEVKSAFDLERKAAAASDTPRHAEYRRRVSYRYQIWSRRDNRMKIGVAGTTWLSERVTV